MEQFNTIYKILKILRDAMHIEEFDSELISAKALDVDEPFWARIMAMMVDKGYVKGIKVRYTFDSKVPKIDMVNPEITLEGLEYLEENSIMRKIANAAKGIISTVT